MNRKIIASLIILVTISAGVSIFLFTANQPQIAPEISVDGGFVKSVSDTSAIVSALSLNMTVHLFWRNGTGIGPFTIVAENVNPERISIQCLSPTTILDSGNSSLTAQVQPQSSRVDVTFSTEITTDNLEFYVFGDSQGYQKGIYEIAEDALTDQPDFVFHLGDLTPFGQQNQYEAVSTALHQFHVPVFTTIGNHDIRLGGVSYYSEYFGPSMYSFDYGSAHFAVFNTSTGDVSQSELAWLESDLSHSDSDWKFVFTHMPIYDPRPSFNHTILNATTASILNSLFTSTHVNAVFAGHIHLYNHSVINGIDYVISGGAGATLYADSEDGGIYHYVRVTIQETSMTITPVVIPEPSINRDMVVIRGHSEDITLTIDDLMQLNQTEGFSSFQNFYGNLRGQGMYVGVKVSDLLKLIGGMDSSDLLTITSSDGYQQDYSYSNVYPNASWHALQGDMLLAFSYNGTLVPDWNEGLRIIMLPEDGIYSNDDCLATSELGMGYNIYPSAGARWVSNVKLIEVIGI